EQLFDLGELENVELALLALGIGVQGRKEPTLLALHFRKEPAGNLPRRISKKRLAERSMGVHVKTQKKRVVVEHLLEVRHEPRLVRRVAMEASREVIPDAAFAHRMKGERDGGFRLLV